MFISTSKLRSAALTIVFTLSLTGCRDLNLQPGHYEGSLIEGKGWNLLGEEHVPNELVSIDLLEEKDQPIIFRISDLHQKKQVEIKVTKNSRNTFKLEIPKLAPIIFKPEKYTSHTEYGDMKCFRDFSNYKINLCPDYDEFKLTVQDPNHQTIISLAGGRFSRETPFILETPRKYTLSEAINLAMKKNVASRIEYKQLIKSKESASAAYLQLLPHVRIQTGLSIAAFAISLSPLALLNDLQDLAPFLFPGRWISAKQARLQSYAQQDSYRIMQANLANQVEGLTHSLITHKAQFEIYNNLINRVEQLLKKVTLLENAGKMKTGSIGTIQALNQTLILGRKSVNSAIDTDREVLSFTAGLLNPEGIEDITVDHEEIPIEQARPLNPSEIARFAVDRSLEVRQLSYIIEAAVKEKASLLLNWLDPVGNPFTPLGLNLVPQLKATKANLDIFIAQQDQRRMESSHLGMRSARKYNSMIQTYKEALQFKLEQEQRANQALSQIENVDMDQLAQIEKIEVKASEIRGLLEDYLGIALLTEGYLANFRAARAKVERVLLAGYFNQVNNTTVKVSLKDFELPQSSSGTAPTWSPAEDTRKNPHLQELIEITQHYKKAE